MGKILVLVRHAKSSWNHLDLDDFDRPLNDRGKHDAPEMAKRLKKTPFRPELLVSSPAKRALSTARKFARVFDLEKDEIIRIPELYHASSEKILKRIHSLPEEIQKVALFGHNPGLSDFVSQYSSFQIANMPTASIVVLEISHWSDFGKKPAAVKWYDYPKSK